MVQNVHGRGSFIAVIGAGTMGSGIAQKYATHGHRVTIVDKDPSSLERSQLSISKTLEQGVLRNVLSAEEAQAIKARLSFASDLPSIKDADLVIEAIFENLALKQELFNQLDKICSLKTVLATNTSSLKIEDLVCDLNHPERVVGLHYFYPPAKNRLVEIIATKQTSHDVAKQAQDWQTSIKKTAIHSKDSPGFVVNRFFVPWLNEAMRIVDDGIANIASVEKAAQTFFQIGMGPFQLMNVTGLPITLHSCDALAKALGEFYAPSPSIIPLIENRDSWNLTGSVNEDAQPEIGLRLLAVVAVLSCQLVFKENVCAREDVDIGAQTGLMWKQGPFALIATHHQAISRALARMKQTKVRLPDISAYEHYVKGL